MGVEIPQTQKSASSHPQKRKKAQLTSQNISKRQGTPSEAEQLEPSHAWRLVPSPVTRRYTDTSTFAGLRYVFLSRALMHTIPPNTADDVCLLFQSIPQTSYENKLEGLADIRQKFNHSQLIGRRLDLYPSHTTEAEACAQDMMQKIFDRHLPAWITGAVTPTNLLSVEAFVESIRAEEGGGKLQGRIERDAQVIDGSQGIDMPNPIGTSLEQFVNAIVKRRESVDFLGFTDLVNNTDVRMTPDAIEQLSLEAILRRRDNSPRPSAEFFLATTTGYVSNIQQAPMGYMGWFRPVSGAMTLNIPACDAEEAEELYRAGKPHLAEGQHLFAPGWQFCGVNLSDTDKGACWIHPPGQKYWFYTSKTAFFVGGYFYTAELFPLSIRAIGRHLLKNSTGNEKPTTASFTLLVRIIEHLLDDESVFTAIQKDHVGHELDNIVRAYEDQKAPMPEWYHTPESRKNGLSAACDEFVESARRWVQDWTVCYKRACESA